MEQEYTEDQLLSQDELDEIALEVMNTVSVGRTTEQASQIYTYLYKLSEKLNNPANFIVVR